MILVTGGTGFIGQALIRRLLEDGREVRTLLKPSAYTPDLPKGLPVEIALSNILDERSLRTALAGVEMVFHLVGAEWLGVDANLGQIEIEGTRTLLKVARESGVQRIVYMSHLGAERGSAYPVLKTKGIVEEMIRRSGLTYGIIRSSLVYGPGDHFTTDLAKLMAVYPLVFFLPGIGEAKLQPVFVEDIATCLSWLVEDKSLTSQTIEVGGPEFLTIQQVIEDVMANSGIRRRLVHLRPSYLRIVAIFMEYLFPGFPHSVYWLDYLANDRTCDIDSISRNFGLLPVRMTDHLDHLQGVNWRRAARRDLRRKPAVRPIQFNW